MFRNLLVYIMHNIMYVFLLLFEQGTRHVTSQTTSG